MKNLLLCLALAAGVGGCASTPDIKVGYYLPTTTVKAKVTRTLTCDNADNIFIANTVVLTPVHSADTSQQIEFDISELDGTFSNTSFTIELYDDGRLKGVNASSEGQAGEALKTGIELLSSKLGAFRNQPYPGECDLINRFKRNDAGKVVRTETLTLSYEGSANPAFNSSSKAVPLSTSLDGRYSTLLDLTGNPRIKTGANTAIAPPVVQTSLSGKSYPTVELRPAALVEYTVSIEGATALDQFKTASLHKQSVRIANANATAYKVPVPKAASFGSTEFALAVSESGAVTKLTYGSDSGATQLIGVAGGFPDDEADPTTAERAAEIKAQADLIAQQARLVRCQANPSECT